MNKKEIAAIVLAMAFSNEILSLAVLIYFGYKACLKLFVEAMQRV